MDKILADAANIPGPMDHKKYQAGDALENSIAGRAQAHPGTSNAKLFGRRERRKLHPVHTGSYHHPKRRTGQPDWFRTMKVKSAVKAELSKLPLSALADRVPERFLGFLEYAGYSNVWDLSQAKREDLLKVKGIGPAALAKVRAGLVGRSVPVAWKV